MAKILVLYYSSYGHIEKMAHAVAEGVVEAGAEVDVKRVPETAPDDVVKSAGFKTDQESPIAKIEELADYDAIILGVGTRYGHISSQMAAFWDTTGGLWAKGVFPGKVGATFTSSASQHGGQETTLLSNITMMMHLGMLIVGLPYSYEGLSRLDEVTGGTPYGATTIAGGDGERWPSDNELGAARCQGKHVAEITAKLMSGTDDFLTISVFKTLAGQRPGHLRSETGCRREALHGSRTQQQYSPGLAGLHAGYTG